MILEGVVTTIDEAGDVNIAPMGPIVDESFQHLVFRPFTSSTTYRNLKRTGQGVLHVTDDVELIARAAVGPLDPLPEMYPAEAVEGCILEDACRWFAFQVRSLDDSQQRTRIEAEVVDGGTLRDFFGFNRAKHAVIEAAILATRLHLLPLEEVQAELARLAVPVQKTAGPREQAAFDFLRQHIEQYARSTDRSG